jgi:hypothetical protein
LWAIWVAMRTKSPKVPPLGRDRRRRYAIMTLEPP